MQEEVREVDQVREQVVLQEVELVLLEQKSKDTRDSAKRVIISIFILYFLYSD